MFSLIIQAQCIIKNKESSMTSNCTILINYLSAYQSISYIQQQQATMALGLSTLKSITVYIYDFFISMFLTITSHLVMTQHMTYLTGSFLDVGCGTGAPLQAILPSLQRRYHKIVGIDLDSEYIKKAKDRFKNNLDVSIYQMDFYKLTQNIEEKFNFILFSFSFMLMPQKIDAIQIAKQALNTNGRIGFIMTLNKKQNKWLQKLKPIIKKLTTIDFGEVVYEAQFEQILKIGNLEIVKKQRITSPYNLILKFGNVYYIEAKVKE